MAPTSDDEGPPVKAQVAAPLNFGQLDLGDASVVFLYWHE